MKEIIQPQTRQPTVFISAATVDVDFIAAKHDLCGKDEI